MFFVCSGVFFHFQFEQLSRDVQRTLQGESPTYAAVARSAIGEIVHFMRCCACLIDVEKLCFRCHVSTIVENKAISKTVCAHSAVYLVLLENMRNCTSQHLTTICTNIQILGTRAILTRHILTTPCFFRTVWSSPKNTLQIERAHFEEHRDF